MTWRVRTLTVLAVSGIVACGEPPVAPEATMRAVASSAHLTQAERYIVYFNNDVPSALADRVAALGGTVVASYTGAGLAVVSGLTESAALSLSDLGEVGVDESFQAIDPAEAGAPEAVADAVNVGPASASNPAGASAFWRQWNMRQVRAPHAWAAGHLGSPSVKVAILDTGIDYLYPDLVGRVDLQNSTDLTQDGPIVQAFFPGRLPFTDLHYHGTHVAATVASNANVIAGVTSGTTLMAVKVLSYTGSGLTSWILGGIVWAADHGADVINMSVGVSNPPFSMKNKGNKDFFNKVMDRAFKYANTKGVTMVVAAGNEGQNLDVKQSMKMYCGAMHVICVSATGPASVGGNPDTFASYSNYGDNRIDVAAPGGNSGAFVYSACSTSSLYYRVCGTGTYILSAAGTSMATPHVAGLAAMLIAEQKSGRAIGDIRSAIFNGAVDLGAPGKDAYFGNGRIDVAKSVGLQ